MSWIFSVLRVATKKGETVFIFCRQGIWVSVFWFLSISSQCLHYLPHFERDSSFLFSCRETGPYPSPGALLRSSSFRPLPQLQGSRIIFQVSSGKKSFPVVFEFEAFFLGCLLPATESAVLRGTGSGVSKIRLLFRYAHPGNKVIKFPNILNWFEMFLFSYSFIFTF